MATYQSNPFSITVAPPAPVLAFPGAEGFGKDATGGRGGTVLFVTNLNDSGTGSLRAALTASGARYIVFTVSGHIQLSSNIRVANGNFTLAGQTSPGGILVVGGHIIIECANFIIRHIRCRPGSHVGDPNTVHALELLGPTWAVSGAGAENGYLDHCSFGWGIDETLSLTGGVQNVTVGWCIAGEGLNNAGHDESNHSKAMFVSCYESANPTYVSMHHNFLPLSLDRVPMLQHNGSTFGAMKLEGWNNVTYGWKGGLSPVMDSNCQVDWRHNYARGSSISHPWAYGMTLGDYAPGAEKNQLFIEGSLSPNRTSQAQDEWDVGEFYYDRVASTGFKKAAAYNWNNPTVTTMSAAYAATVVAGAGATAPSRDSADSAAATHFTNTTGAAPENVSYPSSFPTYSTPAAPTDSNNDGIPDAWTTANMGGAAWNDVSPSGYIWLEVYLNELAGD